MDHADAVRLNATERYVLNEMDPTEVRQFEEHFFICHECELDISAATKFLEHSKDLLAETAEHVPVPAPVPIPAPPPAPGWLAWLRPTFAVPVMAGLLLVIGYQNFVTVPRLKHAAHSPQVLPWAAVNVGTWGAGGPPVSVTPGQSFLLFVRIPPEAGFARYTADLYNPAGQLEWTLTFPAVAGQDQWPMQVPGADRPAGMYTLKVRGITAAGENRDLGRTSFDLQIQK